MRESEKTPFSILHVPHSSTLISGKVFDQFVLRQNELDRELLKMTDRYSDELFALPQALAVIVRFPVSRLVVDPERFLQCADRPLICIGIDELHTPVWLSKYVVEEFRRSFGSVAINRPFSGALVPELYLGKDKRVLAIMIEVNRAVYMNEESGEKLPGFKKTADSLKKTAIQIIEIVRHRNT